MRRRTRIGDDLGSVTLREALESYRVDELKQMAGLVMQKVPTRHGELVAAIMAAMSGDGLEVLWARLNEIEQAAVAEAVCGPGGYLSHARFIANMGRPRGRALPNIPTIARAKAH